MQWHRFFGHGEKLTNMWGHELEDSTNGYYAHAKGRLDENLISAADEEDVEILLPSDDEGEMLDRNSNEEECEY